MRLQKADLESKCELIKDKTNGQFRIIIEKTFIGYRLELVNERTKTAHPLTSWNLRECYFFLTAFYRGLDYSKLLAW